MGAGGEEGRKKVGKSKDRNNHNQQYIIICMYIYIYIYRLSAGLHRKEEKRNEMGPVRRTQRAHPVVNLIP